MINYRPLPTLLIGCLAVVFWFVSASSVAAFFDDNERSPENRWQGAVVNVALDAPVPLTTPDLFTVGKHPQSLDLYYQLTVVADSVDTCEGVTLELTGPAGTTTATVATFPVVPATELGQWGLSATHSAAASELDCQFTLQVKAWAKETPEVGFSDTKDILVVVPGRSVSAFTAGALTTGGTNEITAASLIAPQTGPSGAPVVNESQEDASDKAAEQPEEPAPEDETEGEGSDEPVEEEVEGDETDTDGEGEEQTEGEPDESTEAGEEGKEESAAEETDDAEADGEVAPASRPEDETPESEPKEEEPNTPPSDVDSESETAEPDTPDAKPEEEPEVTETETDV